MICLSLCSLYIGEPAIFTDLVSADFRTSKFQAHGGGTYLDHQRQLAMSSSQVRRGWVGSKSTGLNTQIFVSAGDPGMELLWIQVPLYVYVFSYWFLFILHVVFRQFLMTFSNHKFFIYPVSVSHFELQWEKEYKNNQIWSFLSVQSDSVSPVCSVPSKLHSSNWSPTQHSVIAKCSRADPVPFS